MNIDEGNELIAEFLGYSRKVVRYQEKSYNSSNEFYYRWTEGELWCDEAGHPLDDEYDELLFHANWDWLMPLVFKIESLGCIVNISISLTNHIRIVNPSLDNMIISSIESNDLQEAIWLACIDYITWYNIHCKTNE